MNIVLVSGHCVYLTEFSPRLSQKFAALERLLPPFIMLKDCIFASLTLS